MVPLYGENTKTENESSDNFSLTRPVVWWVKSRWTPSEEMLGFYRVAAVCAQSPPLFQFSTMLYVLSGLPSYQPCLPPAVYSPLSQKLTSVELGASLPNPSAFFWLHDLFGSKWTVFISRALYARACMWEPCSPTVRVKMLSLWRWKIRVSAVVGGAAMPMNGSYKLLLVCVPIVLATLRTVGKTVVQRK